MGRMTRKNINKVNMTVNLDVKYYEHLKKLSYKLSVKENVKIGLSEIVRRALEKSYPIITEQLELEF